MQTRAFNPQDWTHPLSGYRLAGWIEGLGLLVGIGAIPLLVQLPKPTQQLAILWCSLAKPVSDSKVFWEWLAGYFWAVGLGAGLLVLVAGLYYLVRSGRLARAQARLAEDTDQVLADEQLNGFTIRVTARRTRQVAEVSSTEVAPQSSAVPLDDIRQATPLIILGIFILLPAVAFLLLHPTEPADAYQLAAYLGGPALMMWAVFEGLAFYAHWQQRSSGRGIILGMIRSVFQVLAALLVWIFLGLADSIDWMIGLFGIAAGLTLMSALVGTFMPATGRQDGAQATTPLPSDANHTESILMGTRTEPLSPADQPEEVAAPVPQPEAAGVEQKPAVKTRARFQVFRGKDGQYYFRLRAANGEIILSSEGYRSKSGCQNGIQSVRQNAPLAERYRHSKASDGRYYFVLKAANHRVIGVSQRYTTPAGREAGIQAVMRVAPQAGTEEIE